MHGHVVKEVGRRHYIWRDPKTGTFNESNVAPNNASELKVVTLIYLDNGTDGRIVFTETALDEYNRRVAAKHAGDMSATEQRSAAAKARCEAEFGDRMANRDRLWRESFEADQRLLEARLETIRARSSLSSMFDDLNRLREAQDLAQDFAGIAIDVAGFAASGGTSLALKAAIVAAGAANTMLRTGDTGLQDRQHRGLAALGENLDPEHEALAEWIADGTGGLLDEGGYRVGGRIVGGALALSDMTEFIKHPELYPSTASNLAAVEAIQKHFNNPATDPRGIFERVWGPKKPEMNARFERVKNAMKNEQLAEADARSKRRAYEADKTELEIGVCIRRLEAR
jgi:hypothetical protein